jgi:tetrahydromethanopterin S-methyltransferase subunit G
MKPQQITIKYSKGLDTGTQVIDLNDYYKVKSRLEKLGYKVEKL